MPREGQTATNQATGERAVFQGGQWVKQGAPKLTEDQGKASTYAKLMNQGELSYQAARKDGYNPGSFGNAAAGLAESIDLPLIGKPFAGLGPIIRDDVSDRGRAAELLWRDAQLKAMTGAGQSAQEATMNEQTYFPGVGDASDHDKEMARRAAYDAARMRAGPGGAGLPPYAAGGSLPAQARARLQAGKSTTFQNGQVWTLRNGQPVRVK